MFTVLSWMTRTFRFFNKSISDLYRVRIAQRQGVMDHTMICPISLFGILLN